MLRIDSRMREQGWNEAVGFVFYRDRYFKKIEKKILFFTVIALIYVKQFEIIPT